MAPYADPNLLLLNSDEQSLKREIIWYPDYKNLLGTLRLADSTKAGGTEVGAPFMNVNPN